MKNKPPRSFIMRNVAISAYRWLFFLGTILVFSLSISIQPAVAADDLVQHGEYIFHLAGCNSCHTDSKHHGAKLAGGYGLVTPFGTFYTPNITPDPKYGIGKWSEQDFVRAVTLGISPSGYYYYPVFPYTSYTRISSADVHALWTYLRSVPPVAQPNKPHEKAWYLNRFGNEVWQNLFFKSGHWESQAGQSEAWNRGAYLANALAHCSECHTPRNFMGALKSDLAYAGTNEGPEGAKVPNITSDRDTGIGNWIRKDFLAFMKDGSLPDGDYTGGLMAEVVDNGLSHLNTDDAEALVTYIASLPPIRNEIIRKKQR